MDCEDSMFRGYGEFHLFMTYTSNFVLLLFPFLGVVRDAPNHLRDRRFLIQLYCNNNNILRFTRCT